MKNFKALKYSIGFILPVLTWYSFSSHGWVTYLPLLYTFFVIPLVELVLKPDPSNFNQTEQASELDNVLYDILIYLMVPVQLVTLGFFLVSMQEEGLMLLDKVGRISSMGLCCGILGINIGHELGHRKHNYEKWMAKINLMTSLNMHFMHEHNIHHHRMVSTPEDPATSKLGEPVYFFWFRSIFGVYSWAWKLEKQRLKRKGIHFWSIRNQMITDHVIEIGLLIIIGFFFGLSVLGYFVLAALMGHFILETVNYIEHYGLMRDKKGDRYERVMPQHSWNSDHILGRLNLFELSRHSDHHFIASRKYQILRHMDDSPQMPTGYPGMMLLSLIPPIWFAVMNPKVTKINQNKAMD